MLTMNVARSSDTAERRLQIKKKQYKQPTYDLLAALRYRRTRWLGQILRLEESRLLRQMAMSMEVRPMVERKSRGSLLMDAPPHENMEELADMAGSKDSEEGAEKMRQWHLAQWGSSVCGAPHRSAARLQVRT